jgi:hypothetical protein
VVGASILWASGRRDLVVPGLGGVAWGILNVELLARLLEHLRPDRTRNPARIALDIVLKFPAMYVAAFLLLRRQTTAQILTAGAGFALVLLAFLLRALGALATDASARSGPTGR